MTETYNEELRDSLDDDARAEVLSVFPELKCTAHWSMPDLEINPYDIALEGTHTFWCLGIHFEDMTDMTWMQLYMMHSLALDILPPQDHVFFEGIWPTDSIVEIDGKPTTVRRILTGS